MTDKSEYISNEQVNCQIFKISVPLRLIKVVRLTYPQVYYMHEFLGSLISTACNCYPLSDVLA